MKKTYPLRLNITANRMCQNNYDIYQAEIRELPGIFQEELQPLHYEKSRSSINIVLQSIHTGCRYYMSLKEFWRLFEKRRFDGGFCRGEFRVVKNGSSYHIVLNDIPGETC